MHAHTHTLKNRPVNLPVIGGGCWLPSRSIGMWLSLKRCTCMRATMAVMSTEPWDAQRQGSLTGSDSRTSGTVPHAHLQYAHTHKTYWTSRLQADRAPLNNVRKQHAFCALHSPIGFSLVVCLLSLFYAHTHTRTHGETPSIRPETNGRFTLH